MRGRLLLAVAAALLLSGCLDLATPERVLEREPVEVPPGQTWERGLSMPPGSHGEATWSVRTLTPGQPLVACLVPPQLPFADDWNDSLILEMEGCRTLGAGEVENGSTEPMAGGSTHVLRLHCLGHEACRAEASLSARSVSEAASAAWIVGVVVLAALVMRILADQMDRARIRDFVAGRGGRVESISWQPFGRGWFGERGERIYAVRFVERGGREREATFKTSLFSGVWTDRLDEG